MLPAMFQSSIYPPPRLLIIIIISGKFYLDCLRRARLWWAWPHWQSRRGLLLLLLLLGCYNIIGIIIIVVIIITMKQQCKFLISKDGIII